MVGGKREGEALLTITDKFTILTMIVNYVYKPMKNRKEEELIAVIAFNTGQ